MGSVHRLGAALTLALAATGLTLTLSAPVLAAPRPGAVPALGPVRLAQPTEPQPGGPPQPLPPPGVVFVEVTPSVVQPGYLVAVRASCPDNTWPATVWSDAFGRVTVHPDQGVLTATPMVRDRTRAGNYPVKLECRTGETASTTLQVIKRPPPTHAPTHRPTHRPSHGPATGFGGTAGPGLGDLLVPAGLALTLGGAVAGILAARRSRRSRQWWGPA